MSSRLLPLDGPFAVEAVAWPVVGGPDADESSPGRTDAGGDSAGEAERARQLEQARQQRIQAAHAAGVREGEAAAREKAAGEVRAAVEKLARAIDEVNNLKPRLRREAEADLIRLAIAIAKRILHREIAVDPDAMRGLVIAAMEKIKGREVHQVRVHPNLAPMLTDALRRVATDRAPEVVADPTREPGTLIFETGRGNLDASVDAQLQEIGNGLADCLHRSR
jgi:flagellar assembly protein FliH